jgi:hypothetical protein
LAELVEVVNGFDEAQKAKSLVFFVESRHRRSCAIGDHDSKDKEIPITKLKCDDNAEELGGLFTSLSMECEDGAIKNPRISSSAARGLWLSHITARFPASARLLAREKKLAAASVKAAQF